MGQLHHGSRRQSTDLPDVSGHVHHSPRMQELMWCITLEEDLGQVDGLDDLSPASVHDLLPYAENNGRESLLPLLHGWSNIRKTVDVNPMRRGKFRLEDGNTVPPGNIWVVTVGPAVDDNRLVPLDGDSACHSQILLLLLTMALTAVMVVIQPNLANSHTARMSRKLVHLTHAACLGGSAQRGCGSSLP